MWCGGGFDADTSGGPFGTRSWLCLSAQHYFDTSDAINSIKRALSSVSMEVAQDFYGECGGDTKKEDDESESQGRQARLHLLYFIAYLPEASLMDNAEILHAETKEDVKPTAR